jgi:hypothetical protein
MEAKHQCRQGLGRFTSMPWFDTAEYDTAGDEFKKKLELELKLRAANALNGSGWSSCNTNRYRLAGEDGFLGPAATLEMLERGGSVR